MPFTIPATSDANIELSAFNIPATSDANIEFDPLTSYVLTIANAAHAVTADNVTMTVKYAAVIANATHAVTADNVTVTQKFALTIANATHAVTADNLELTFHPGAPSTPTGWARGMEYFNYLQKQYEDELDDEEILSVMYA